MKIQVRVSLRVALVVLAVVASLVSIATLGRTLPPTAFGWIPFEGPSDADSTGINTAVVDSASRRVLILNDDDRITGIVECNALNSPLEAITNVCVTNKTVYVAGVKYQKDSDIITQERIVAYNMAGRSEKIVYDQKIDNETMPTIKALEKGENDDVYVMVQRDSPLTDDMSAFELLHVDRREARKVEGFGEKLVGVFRIGYSAKADTYATISIRGLLNDEMRFAQSDKTNADADAKTAADDAKAAAGSTPIASEKTDEKDTTAKKANTDTKNAWDDCVFTSVDIADDGNVYVYDDVSERICRIGDNGVGFERFENGSGCSSLNTNGTTLSACGRDQNLVVVMDLNGTLQKELTGAQIAPSLSLLTCFILGCRAYLVAFYVCLLVRRIRRVGFRKSARKVIPMLGSAVVVFVVMLAIGYTAYGSYTAMMTTRAKELDVFADYLATIAPSNLSESMEKCNNRDIYRLAGVASADVFEGLVDIETQVNGLAIDATFNGLGTYTVVYGMDERGVFYLTGSSDEQVMGTSAGAATKADEIKEVFDRNAADEQIRTGSTLRDTTIYRLVAIPTTDNTGTAGVIEVGSRMRTFSASVAQDQAQRIIALLVLVLVVYLTYEELRECAACFEAFFKTRHHHDSIAVLTRPFSFFITLVSSIDAVMSTLIAREMLSVTGMATSGFLLALPSVMMGVGLAVGQAVYGLIGSRVVIHKLMTRGAILVVLSAIFAAVVVWRGNYPLYCFAKLLMAIPFGLLYTQSYSLPRRADTEDIRALAAGGIKRTDTSAAALGTVLGGYAAQALGNAWVYVLVAAVGCIVWVMADRVLPSTQHPLEHDARRDYSRSGAILHLVSRKSTLCIAFFVMLPGILAAGYNSFMFPLFSANLGIPASSINNLFVFGQLVVYVCISAIEWLEERYDKWWLAFAAVALLGIVFLLFSFNTTIVWAVVTIALVGLLCKTADAWKALWPRSAHGHGLATGMATGAMFAVRSLLLIVQPLLLGALLSVGDQAAVIVLGCICLACATAFYFTTRHSSIAPQVE